MTNSIAWRSPSNIALIKYWGKFGRQEPRNASISLTLDNAFSDTQLDFAPRPASDQLDIKFRFEGKENPAFAARVEQFLASILADFPFLREYQLDIQSHNSFPHSAGIASSASGLSALALCIADMSQQIGFTHWSPDEFLQNASHFSRLASGSACRSLFPSAAIWGQTQHFAAASNRFAVPFDHELHPDFKSYHNDILFVSKAEKQVSSSAGHELMNNNPFAQARYQQADDNLGRLLDHLRNGDLHAAGDIIEEEALTLHALMSASRPSFILMQPNTLLLIHRIRAFRRETGLPLYFTLDAGPNIHLLYPDHIAHDVQPFLQNQLLPHCENQQFLADRVGQGAHKIN